MRIIAHVTAITSWGAAFIVAGVGFFAYTLLDGIFHITDSLTQVVVPGEGGLTLQPKLEYTIFVEQQSVVDGRIFSVTENFSGLRCHVRSGGVDEAEIALRPSHNSTTYNLKGRSGRSVLEFDTGESTEITSLARMKKDSKVLRRLWWWARVSLRKSFPWFSSASEPCLPEWVGLPVPE